MKPSEPAYRTLIDVGYAPAVARSIVNSPRALRAFLRVRGSMVRIGYRRIEDTALGKAIQKKARQANAPGQKEKHNAPCIRNTPSPQG